VLPFPNRSEAATLPFVSGLEDSGGNPERDVEDGMNFTGRFASSCERVCSARTES